MSGPAEGARKATKKGFLNPSEKDRSETKTFLRVGCGDTVKIALGLGSLNLNIG